MGIHGSEEAFRKAEFGKSLWGKHIWANIWMEWLNHKNSGA